MENALIWTNARQVTNVRLNRLAKTLSLDIIACAMTKTSTRVSDPTATRKLGNAKALNANLLTKDGGPAKPLCLMMGEVSNSFANAKTLGSFWTRNFCARTSTSVRPDSNAELDQAARIRNLVLYVNQTICINVSGLIVTKKPASAKEQNVHLSTKNKEHAPSNRMRIQLHLSASAFQVVTHSVRTTWTSCPMDFAVPLANYRSGPPVIQNGAPTLF